jgi:hypothetical protein
MQDAIEAFRSDEALRNEIFRSTKQKLLDKYANREPTPFEQFDGFYVNDGGDDIMRPDDEDHCLFSSDTWELMHGADVRVLVSRDTPREQVGPLIRKLAAWIANEYSKPASDDWKELKDMPFRDYHQLNDAASD